MKHNTSTDVYQGYWAYCRGLLKLSLRYVVCKFGKLTIAGTHVCRNPYEMDFWPSSRLVSWVTRLQADSWDTTLLTHVAIICLQVAQLTTCVEIPSWRCIRVCTTKDIFGQMHPRSPQQVVWVIRSPRFGGRLHLYLVRSTYDRIAQDTF